MNNSLCEKAYEVNNNGWILLIWSIVVCLNTCGILATLHVTRLLLWTQVEVFHVNLRILFANLSLGLMLRSAFTLYRAMQQIILAITWKDKCDFVQDVYACSIQSRINLTPFNSCVYSYLAVALERAIATLTYRRYEKRRNELIAVLLALTTWIHPTIELVNTVKRDVKGVREREYCSALTGQPIVLSQVTYSEHAAAQPQQQIPARRKYPRIEDHTSERDSIQHYNTAQYPLPVSFRTQQAESRNPRIRHFQGIVFFVVLFPSVHESFQETMSLTVPVYINLYAWILIIRCPQFAKRTYFIRRFSRLTKQSPQAEIKGPNYHFNMLSNFWT
uniref:G_PROTEIN_RECEP_F1_2 domain-containing protein n=1 Tax=Steinernema glaseri TaxID=37863 RepID=A0A1I8ATC6_9BILA